MAVVAAAFTAACGDEVPDISPDGALTDSLGVAVWTVPGRVALCRDCKDGIGEYPGSVAGSAGCLI